MSRRFLTCAAIVIWSLIGSSVRSAAAQERLLDNATPVASINASVVKAIASTTATPPAVQLPEGFRLAKGRSYGMLPLYVGSIVLHAMDIHSTFKVIDRGGREGNPMLAGLVNNRPAFIAVKGAIAASSIYAVSRIAKKNKIAGFAVGAALNSVYSMVVSHNYRLAQSLR